MVELVAQLEGESVGELGAWSVQEWEEALVAQLVRRSVAGSEEELALSCPRGIPWTGGGSSSVGRP